jgi:hypothetical protein
MGAFLEFVSAVQAWVSYIVAPHAFALVMLMSAVTWGWSFCAPAFRPSSAVKPKGAKSERGHAGG